MSIRLLPAGAAVLMLSMLAPVHAQTASAPAAMPSPPAEPAPATEPAPPPSAATSADASQGKVAYYGRKFAGRKTASGERFNPNAMTMAHKTLPMGSMVRVTNMTNKRSVVVRVNDRGPSTPDRIGDVTQAAAKKIGMTRSGVVEAGLEVVSTAKTGQRAKSKTTRHA